MLAALLTSDADLKRRLIEQQVSEVSVSADEKNNCIRIEYGASVKDMPRSIFSSPALRFQELPPFAIFDICDLIAAKAKVVRQRITGMPTSNQV